MRNWMHYTFTVKERPDGSPWVSVATPLGQDGHDAGDATVALRLNLCATYADAKEIADFLNRKVHLLRIAQPDAARQAALQQGVLAVQGGF